MIRVVVADDHALIREGLTKLLELEDDIEVLGEAGDGQGAINLARRYHPDVILMDINMPVTDGITATRVIKREMPHTRIIALTVYEDEQVVEMVKAGVSAYILKDVAAQELMSTIRRVMEGNVFIHPRVASRVVKELTSERERYENRLTRREKDILDLVVKGNSNKEIAGLLYISEKTVKNHLTNIFRKLSVKDRTQAAVYALKNGLVKYEQNS
ncbi:MAG: response regulator transcription factor [Syntrophomonadaceae bacterium]|nr:response regulator transcription factor [Syntrophomonadaceae bacterium]